jgi:soluble cytochrome b562
MITTNDLIAGLRITEPGIQQISQTLDHIKYSKSDIIAENAELTKKYLQQLQNKIISNAEFKDLLLDLQDKVTAIDAADNLEEKEELDELLSTLIFAVESTTRFI